MSLTLNEHSAVIQDLLRADRPVKPAAQAASKRIDDDMRPVLDFQSYLRLRLYHRREYRRRCFCAFTRAQ